MEYVSFGEGVVSNHQRHKRPPLFSGESHPNGIDPRFHYRCTCRWQPEPLTRLRHNSTTIGGSQQMPQKATINATKATMPSRPQNRLGFQEPKRDKLQ